jgi:hypothetical protein
MWLGKGEYDRAATQCMNAKTKYQDTEVGKNLLFESGVICKYYLGDETKARSAFETFISQYPDEKMAEMARVELSGISEQPSARFSSSPDGFQLAQNYPNPFNPETEITFTLPEASNVTLTVHNILGQVVEELVNSEMQAGNHTVSWNGNNVASGVYFYRITAGPFSDTKRMLLLK